MRRKNTIVRDETADFLFIIFYDHDLNLKNIYEFTYFIFCLKNNINKSWRNILFFAILFDVNICTYIYLASKYFYREEKYIQKLSRANNQTYTFVQFVKPCLQTKTNIHCKYQIFLLISWISKIGQRRVIYIHVWAFLSIQSWICKLYFTITVNIYFEILTGIICHCLEPVICDNFSNRSHQTIK